ncbi:MAG: site-2 protease family protein [bacterium]
MLSPERLLLLAPPILVALTVHEFAHAFAADRLGDPTARTLGRLTLNPLKHLDPLGTIMLFVANFGWAKPVPVNPQYFRHPNRDMLLVAAAGPVSNLILALISGLILRLSHTDALPMAEGSVTVLVILRYSLFINLVLAFFNLLPIPPLDGSKILRSLLPPHMIAAYLRFESVGPVLLLVIIVIGQLTSFSPFWLLIGPPVEFLSRLFSGSAVVL